MRDRDIEEAPRQDDPAQLDGALERWDGLGDVAPAKGYEPQAPVGDDEAEVMVDLAGDPDGLLATRHRLRELAELGEAPGEALPREDGSERAGAEPIVEAIALERLYDPAQALDGLSIVSHRLTEQAEREVHR